MALGVILCLGVILARTVPVWEPVLQDSRVEASTYCTPLNLEQDGISVSAESVILVEAQTGSILHASNQHTARGMASTTKIMTAYAVLNTLPLDRQVEITAEMTGAEGSSLYLKVGEILTVEELLYGLMLESGNDAAEALAIACDGSVEGFVGRMNSLAAELGLTNTKFANPHGLSHPEHYTTAYDLAMLTCHALKNETFRKLVSTYSVRIPYNGIPNGRHLVNHNPLLPCYDGMIGVKTGWTTADGKCFVSAAERDGMTLVAVSLGDAGISGTHRALLNYGFAMYRCKTVKAYTPMELPLEGGEKDFLTVECRETVTVCLPKGEDITLRVEAPQKLYAGMPAGSTVGRVVLLYKGEEIGCMPLVTAEDAPVKKITLWEKWFGT